MRRLPVYLLIDVSGSMAGEPIEAVNNGLQTMLSALRKDPHALEQAYISLIAFETDVRQMNPLTEVAQFQIPALSAGGGTSLGAALSLAAKCAKDEVVKKTESQSGDWKPLVFLMTDGDPTDELEKGLADFKNISWGIVVACAAGAHANTAILQKITENVIRLDTADSNSIAAFFRFVSSSISTTSKKADGGKEAGGLNDLPPPPPEISLVKL